MGIILAVFQSVGILLFMMRSKSFVMTVMVKYERCFKCMGKMLSSAFEGLEFLIAAITWLGVMVIGVVSRL